MRVLVTGCNGYVGRQICDCLEAFGFEVTGVARSKHDLPRCPVVQGELTDRPFVNRLLESRDAIVHCAALTRSQSPAELAKSNEGVVRVLVEAAAARPALKFIHVSSDQAVYVCGAYGRSKRACEQLVEEGLQNYVILRLSAVLGPYDGGRKNTFSKVMKSILDGRLLFVPAGGRFLINPIVVDDIAWTVRWFVEQERLPNSSFGVTGDPVSLREIIEAAAQGIGRPARIVPLPLGILRRVAANLRHVLGRVLPQLPWDTLTILGLPIGVDHDLLTRTTGFCPSDVLAYLRRAPGLQPRGLETRPSAAP